MLQQMFIKNIPSNWTLKFKKLSREIPTIFVVYTYISTYISLTLNAYKTVVTIINFECKYVH